MEAEQFQKILEKGLNGLRAEMTGQFAELRVDMSAQFAEVRADMNTQFAEVRADMNAEFAEVRGDMNAQFAEARADMNANDTQLRADIEKVARDTHLAHVAIENLRHDLTIFDEGSSPLLEKRVSALEVRVTRLERKRTPKKER